PRNGYTMSMSTLIAGNPYESTVARLIPDLAAVSGSDLAVHSPIDGTLLANLRCDTREEIAAKIDRSVTAFEAWRDVPAPRRGELIRVFGQKLRDHKDDMARLVTIENGKILTEGRGEVQEMIDICDFAVGLSRQLYGLTIASERPNHVMQENWLPLGPVGVISAFNFPVAVWAWNAALAIVCGDSVLWKPSDKTPLTALAVQRIFEEAIREFGGAPEGLSQILMGDRRTAGAALVEDPRIPLVSATGSTGMGRAIAPQIAARFGRSILELGGNNAVIVSQTADLAVALPSIIFGAVGTAGQRCTSTRRVIAHQSIVDKVFAQLKNAYQSIEAKIGDPLDPNTLVGPLIAKGSYDDFARALDLAKKDAVEVFGGERVFADAYPDAYYVKPAIARMPSQTEIVMHETFAPLLYVLSYRTIEEAVRLNNAVPQGLSSTIMTTDVREAEYFKRYGDCGIANVNIGTSGAEIGGAFGGEKETGGGRESGSDSWKQYMRRQTSTTYFGADAPTLAQGVSFTV
ncbi:MAG TPA: aldehyde dehydrogenase family protein, partial [Fimbriimonadaceae bacterium]|nr:aldehyde dehydrogenase family protein [Fimbriimonadaceae bacterium]